MLEFLHFRVYRHSADRHAEEEVQSEKERIVRGEPDRHGAFPHGIGDLHEGEVSGKQDSGRCCESRPGVFPRHFHDGSHDGDDGQSPEHVERDVPKRAVEVGWKKRRGVSPTQKRETRQNPPKRVVHASPYEKYGQKRQRECDVIGRGDPEEPVDERVFHVGRGRTFVNRPPIRRRTEHSSENEEEAYRYRPSFDELVKIPVPLGKVVDGALLIEVVAYYAQASQGPEARESGEVLRHGSNLSRFIFLKSVFLIFRTAGVHTIS